VLSVSKLKLSSSHQVTPIKFYQASVILHDPAQGITSDVHSSFLSTLLCHSVIVCEVMGFFMWMVSYEEVDERMVLGRFDKWILKLGDCPGARSFFLYSLSLAVVARLCLLIPHILHDTKDCSVLPSKSID
jgi:hypothetical protein